ncbi:MAG: D-alanine--D-alanine ligase [Gammaproteobacteria bacterium]|nr:D-alanine--D-alanine ligase [Gammaproteobacteria bacterium]MCP5317647.1 D-alanine--D-alanine ligase [Chromatiaceae bacterium]MCW5586930.1 D-alanine--D-alanine ligase [Chromatiales bacterium]MCB1818129.1 D-alanine--D-alanine ligase [Gammaproteobacteria bacterium]MCP5434881.1 D-alanine--D-alanine ligase [Chromatiaceae bacterium]
MTLNASDFGRVAVLMGGWAAEREVSLVSGRAVLDGLLARGIDAHGIDVGKDVLSVLAAGGFDRVFNILHGRGGEDGVIQGALEILGLPYTGSGVMGSAIAMDKYRTKLLIHALGLPTPGFTLIQNDDDFEAACALGFPLMVKPALEGSSIGMSRADDRDQLRSAWAKAAEYQSHVMAECWVSGAEYTAAILGRDALPLIKLETTHAFYDYDAKYVADDTRYLIPCGLDRSTESALQTLAMQTFDAVGASGWGRVDILMDEAQRPWVIEVNTVPGMTGHSLVPMAAKAVGIDFNELVWRILAQTLEAR